MAFSGTARWLCGGRLALKQRHLNLGIVMDNMVGRASTTNAKPFLKVRIPSDFRMFHCYVPFEASQKTQRISLQRII
jgi:hypothetical protein